MQEVAKPEFGSYFPSGAAWSISCGKGVEEMIVGAGFAYLGGFLLNRR
jgi:hypothetical protein